MKVTILFLFSILTLFCVTLVPVHTLGNTYYVSTSGNDANADSCCAVANASLWASRLKAGDTLYIRWAPTATGRTMTIELPMTPSPFPAGHRSAMPSRSRAIPARR